VILILRFGVAALHAYEARGGKEAETDQTCGFPSRPGRSEELEEIRLATYRLFTYMYQLIIFSKINYKGT
jgi:hypothetical protein